MNIPITKPTIGKEEVKAVSDVVKSGFLVQGKKTLEVEEMLAKRCNRKYSVMTTSGTSALTAALSLLNLKQGDEIITPAFTFFASASCIGYVRATPVLADIDPDTYNINPESLEKKITKKTKAIIAVDLYGQPFDYDSINKIAKKYKLTLIEDAAQSIGAFYKDKPTGSLGDMSTFSFYGSKIITSGEGGMILTDKAAFTKAAMLFRNHGMNPDRNYMHTTLGFNYRITDMQSALLIEQAKKLEKFVALRRLAAEYYTKKLKNIAGITGPFISEGVHHAFSVYTIRVAKEFGNRDEVLKKLNENGVGARVYYPSTVASQPVWKKLGVKFNEKDYPESVKASKEVLSLPLFPTITRPEQNYVVKTLLACRT